MDAEYGKGPEYLFLVLTSAKVKEVPQPIWQPPTHTYTLHDRYYAQILGMVLNKGHIYTHGTLI